MMTKGWEVGKISYFFYFLIELVLDEALYGIVWYGPLYGGNIYFIVNIYVKWSWPWRILDYECVLVMITQCEVSCLIL